MGFVSEQREKQVIGFARAHLREGEEILAWTRGRHPHARGAFAQTGFLYVTAQKLIVHWAGQAEGHTDVMLKEIDTWGVDTDASGGPVLGVVADDETVYVQMSTNSRKSAEGTTGFLKAFAERAPKVRQPLESEDYEGTFANPRHFDIRHPRRSLVGHTKRIVVTIIGIILMLIGVVLTVLPGPAILFFIFGFAVLGSEYDWAQDALGWSKEKYQFAKQKLKERRSKAQRD
jgi:uncharacterized protein (TIGR02611 family)